MMSKEMDKKLNNYDRYNGEFNTLHEVLKNKLNNNNRNFGRLIQYGKDKKDKVINNYYEGICLYLFMQPNFFVDQL